MPISSNVVKLSNELFSIVVTVSGNDIWDIGPIILKSNGLIDLTEDPMFNNEQFEKVPFSIFVWYGSNVISLRFLHQKLLSLLFLVISDFYQLINNKNSKEKAKKLRTDKKNAKFKLFFWWAKIKLF